MNKTASIYDNFRKGGVVASEASPTVFFTVLNTKKRAPSNFAFQAC